jgi:hypothetical protein
MERKQADSAETHPVIPIGAKSLYCSRKQRNKPKTIGQSIVITEIYGEIHPTTQTQLHPLWSNIKHLFD